MMYVILEDSMVVTTKVDKEIFVSAVEAPDDIVFGDKYENGEWVRCGERPEPTVLTPAERRQHEYETSHLIEWGGGNITVDQANLVYLQYLAEDNTKATDIQTLIIDAKESIRQMYPDEVV